MPFFEQHDREAPGESGDQSHGPGGRSSPVPERLPSPGPSQHQEEPPSGPAPFPNVDNNFGLTPRPKVKSLRVDPLLGLDLGGVKIVRLIGEGGMGRVYEAQQAKPSRSVAVKVIRQGITSEKTLRRFEREAEFLGRLQHPNIAQIFIVGTYSSDIGDVPFYVMEFLANAKPITNYVHEQGLELHDKLRLFKQVCEAVSHGHDRGIVHRDLKPGNILVDETGAPKVIDFGVARSTDSDLTLESMKTDTGQLVGTMQYMSPEQFGPEPDDLDDRTDVYSLGVVLYELLSGQAPYSVKKKAMHEASRVVCEEIPPPLRSVEKSVPRDVSAIAERCLQKDRRRRYHTAGELAADIGRFLEGKPVKAQSGSFLGRLLFPESLQKPLSRRAGLGILIFGTLGLVTLGKLAIPGAKHEPAIGSSAGALPRVLDPDTYWPKPKTVQIPASPKAVPSGLQVRAGEVYRLSATGTCQDSAGLAFGPDGTAPEELRHLFGPPPGLDYRKAQEAFVDDMPRRVLLAQVRGSRFPFPVGRPLRFVAPWSGELTFRVNNEPESGDALSGEFQVTFERIPQPEFMDKDGKTTISTSVRSTKYLLFKPEGIRWQYTSAFASLQEPERPTLLNGIVWWPYPDKPDSESWLELHHGSHRTPLLKTRAFAWAAGPKGVKPVIASIETTVAGGSVSLEGPTPEQPGLTFQSPDVDEITCVVSRPGNAAGNEQQNLWSH